MPELVPVIDDILNEFFETISYQGKIADWNDVEETYFDPEGVEDEEGVEYSNELLNEFFETVEYQHIEEFGGKGSGRYPKGSGGEDKGVEVKVVAKLNKSNWQYELSSYDDEREVVGALWNLAVKNGKVFNNVTLYSAHRDFGSKLQKIIPKTEKSFDFDEKILSCYSKRADHIWNFYIQSAEKQSIQQYATDKILTKYEKRVDFKKIEKSLDTLEAESKEKITEILIKQKDALKSFLSKKIELKQLTPKLINTLQLKYLRELQQTIKETLRESYRIGQEEVSKELNKKKYQKIPPTYAIEWLSEKAFNIKGILEDGLKNKIKNTLLTHLETGEPLKETMLKVEKIYQPYVGTEIISDALQTTPYRIETMIRTNTTAAFNRGRVAMSYGEDLKDYIIAYQFSAVLDDRTTDICRELDGAIIRKDDPDFDRFVPPQHFSCRSILVPITTDDLPFDSITREESDLALALTPEEFGGRVGGITK